MKKNYVFIISVLLFLASCQQKTNTNEKEILLSQIKESEQKSFNDSTLTYNKQKTLETINNYQKFIEKYPEDSLSEKFLYLSAQLSKGMGQNGEAIHHFKVFLEKYPNSKKAPKALFLIAMIYDNDIKDKKEAKKYYQKFIEKYPDNELTKDAKTLLQYIDLSNEELLKVLQEKSKKAKQDTLRTS